jgi:hypothetical protein
VIEPVFTRVWDQLMSRPAGPLKFRFVLQPAMAIFLAVRCGLKDSREGKPPFLAAFFSEPGQRMQLMHDGWKAIARLFLLAVALDCIYQIVVLHWIYPFETLVVATVLAIFPYVLVRGPVNRIASIRKTHDRTLAAKAPRQR